MSVTGKYEHRMLAGRPEQRVVCDLCGWKGRWSLTVQGTRHTWLRHVNTAHKEVLDGSM
jgi:hypothetical protein